MGLFSKLLWKDRAVQYPRRYTDELGAVKTFTPSEGTITEAGTGTNAANLNRMEQGIFDAYWQSAAPLIDGITQDLIYTDGVLTSVNEYFTATSKQYRLTTLTYSGGVLTTSRTQCYSSDGTTIVRDYTDTLSYTGGVLEYVARTVNV